MPKSRKRPKAAAKARQQRRQQSGRPAGPFQVREIDPWPGLCTTEVGATRADRDTSDFDVWLAQQEADVKGMRADRLRAKCQQLAGTLSTQAKGAVLTEDPLATHVVKIVQAGHADVPPTPGVSEGLAAMLWDWIEATSTPGEDIAEAIAVERGMASAVEACARVLLENSVDCTNAIKTRMAELEADGRRIVGGGIDGQGTWDIADWQTGQILAQGTDGTGGYDRAVDRLDADGMAMFHVDHIFPDVYGAFDELPQVPGVPESLADALREWLGATCRSDQDLAEVSGLSLTEVAALRQAAELEPRHAAGA